MTDRRFGHFRLIEEIGRGGMGVVYRAVDDRLGREVALKVLGETYAGSDERRQRLIREARTAARIEHPNVATVYELDESDGQPYVAMELLRGRTLRERLASGPLEPDEAVSIVRGVCSALTEAHHLGIVHRDLKPENIAFSADGTVKVLDFGLATFYAQPDPAFDSEESPTRTMQITQPGRIAGTVRYMSPEQLKGGAVDARSDLFALGVVLHELLTARRPFEGDSHAEIVSSIMKDSVHSVSSLRPDVGTALDSIVARCLEKDPVDRYASAAELDRALGEAASRRRPRGLVVAALVLVAVVAAAIGFWKLVPVVPPAEEGDTLRVAVAPFAPVGGGPDDQGLVVRDLVEREIRAAQEQAPIELLEGRLSEPLLSEEEALSAGRRTGADVVCWGKVLRAGADTEIETRLTLLRPVEPVVASTAGTPLAPDPSGFLQLVQGLSLEGSGELEVLRSSAREVASLVTTISALALIRAGEFAEAERVLGGIEDPTPDQSFYRGLALLRDERRREAAATFKDVLARDDSHTGARLGLIAARDEQLEGVTREEAREVARAAVEATPFDPRANALLFVQQLALGGTGTAEGPDPVMLEQLMRICHDQRGAELPRDVRVLAFMAAWMPVALHPDESSQAYEPLLKLLEECRPILTAVEEDPGVKALACRIADRTYSDRLGCEGWAPQPGEVHPYVYAMAVLPDDDGDPSPELLRQLRAAAESDPEIAGRLSDWALVIGTSEPSAGLEWLDANAERTSRPGDLAFARGTLLARLRRWEEADRELARAEQTEGRSQRLVRMRALTLLALERYDEAIDLTEASHVPERYKAFAAQGRLCDAYGALREGEALQELLMGVCRDLERDETVRDAYTALLRERLRDAVADSDLQMSVNWSFQSVREEPWFRFALVSSIAPDMKNIGDWDAFSVLRSLEQLAGREGVDSEAVDAVARRLSQRMDRMARTREETPRDARVTRAEALVQLGRDDEAERLLLEVMDQDPRNTVAMVALGDLHFEAGRRDEALTWIDRAIEVGPDEARHWRLRGRYILFSDSSDRPPAPDVAEEAERALRESLRLDPDDLKAMALLGSLAAAREDYPSALTWFREASRRGDPWSQVRLAWLLREGLGTDRDEREAMRWLRQAAEQGSSEAAAELGVMYAEGRGSERDDAEALRWFRFAEERDSPMAQNWIGWMYKEGRGVEQNDAEAVRWFRRAAETGRAHAQYSLGLMYESGRGVDRDEAEARRWHALAAEQGHAEARQRLEALDP